MFLSQIRHPLHASGCHRNSSKGDNDHDFSLQLLFTEQVLYTM